ncbi:unnamed protein product, partial [Meganyctiphanes norvegica]
MSIVDRWHSFIDVISCAINLQFIINKAVNIQQVIINKVDMSLYYINFVDFIWSHPRLDGNKSLYGFKQSTAIRTLHIKHGVYFKANDVLFSNMQGPDCYDYRFYLWQNSHEVNIKQGPSHYWCLIIPPTLHIVFFCIRIIRRSTFNKAVNIQQGKCKCPELSIVDRWHSFINVIACAIHLQFIINKFRIYKVLEKEHSEPPKSNKTSTIDPMSRLVPIPYQSQLQPLPPSLQHLTAMIEIIRNADPMTTATSSSASVASNILKLVLLIWPLKFGGDYRPFFTIHDSEFKEYTTRTTAPPNVILGVTNPFFAKTLQHWPHIIRIGDNTGSPSTQKHKLKKAAVLKTVEQKPGVYTKYKPHLQADKGLVKRLLKGVQTGRPVEVQSALLRRHMLELTQSFMIPLERYVTSLMPLQKHISPYKAIPSLRPFNPDEFLATLEQSGPQLTTGIKGDWEGLYRRFFRSVNFSIWFNNRYQDMSDKLSELHLQALSDADVGSWACSRSEVEVVDMVLRLRAKVRSAQSLHINQPTQDKLQAHLKTLFSNLPEDLRSHKMWSILCHT